MNFLLDLFLPFFVRSIHSRVIRFFRFLFASFLIFFWLFACVRRALFDLSIHVEHTHVSCVRCALSLSISRDTFAINDQPFLYLFCYEIQQTQSFSQWLCQVEKQKWEKCASFDVVGGTQSGDPPISTQIRSSFHK